MAVIKARGQHEGAGKTDAGGDRKERKLKPHTVVITSPIQPDTKHAASFLRSRRIVQEYIPRFNTHRMEEKAIHEGGFIK
jgi:hypothetical protein